MSKEKQVEKNPFAPQYFIINKSEPKYDLIKKQLLDSSGCPAGSSHYFIRAGLDNGCICRIRAGNGSVLFYEVLDHLREGISGEDIRDVMSDQKNACPLHGYFYVTPEIEDKLREKSPAGTAGYPVRSRESYTA